MEQVTFFTEGDTLTLCMAGRVDSVTAPETEARLEEIRKEIPYMQIRVDLEHLEYISSAGLRILLRLRKSEPTISLVSVPAEVYETLEMTGFTEMMPIEKAYRKFSVEGCPVIGRGAKGTVYRYNPEIIVKVYNNPDSIGDIRRERELARAAFVLGVPTAISYDIVKVDGKYGSVFELLDCDSFTKKIKTEPEKEDEYVAMFADLLRQIHETRVNPEMMPDARKRMKVWIDTAEGHLPCAAADKIRRMMEEIPESDRMLHNDYHTNNVMLQNGEAILIDMDTLSHGDPVIELANIFVAYEGFGVQDPKVVEEFIGLPYETTKRIWKKFLKAYLQTDDETVLSEVDRKVQLLGYTRVIRHAVHRRNTLDDADGMISLAAEKILTLVGKVEDFCIKGDWK